MSLAARLSCGGVGRCTHGPIHVFVYTFLIAFKPILVLIKTLKMCLKRGKDTSPVEKTLNGRDKNNFMSTISVIRIQICTIRCLGRYR